MPTIESIDETVAVTRDDQWQYIRVPLSVSLPTDELHLHRDWVNGPITLSLPRPKLTPEERTKWLKDFSAKIDEAHAAGEIFELERPFCPPRDVEI